MIRRLLALCRLTRPPAPAGSTLTPERRAEIIEELREEFDLLCLGQPSQWRIDLALRNAEARP
jgi:hypothetical protein